MLIDHGQAWQDRGEHGWRRVVASPEPLEVLDVGPVRALLTRGFVVVAAGGGGIPVVRDPDGTLRGVEAVIDKDLAAALLARTLEADLLVIATDVDHAALGWGTPQQRALGRVTLDRAAEVRGGRATSPAARWARRSRRRAGSSSRRRPVRVITSLDRHRRRRRRATSAPSSTRLRQLSERKVAPCPTPSRSQGPDPQRDRRLRACRLIDDGVIDADRVVAIIGKTEGNGGVNDYTRIIADRAFREVLVEKGADPEQVKASSDRVVRRHRRRDQPARDHLRHRARPIGPSRPTSRASRSGSR